MHNDFKNAIHAAKVEFIKDEDFLKVLSRDESSEKKAGLLQDLHFRNVSQRAILQVSFIFLCKIREITECKGDQFDLMEKLHTDLHKDF